MKRKILFVQTNYQEFLNTVYEDNPEWQKLTYDQLKKRLQEKCFGSANFYSKNLQKIGWDATDIIINDYRLQSKWAAEHKLKIKKDIKLFSFLPESVKHYLGLRGWVKQIALKQIHEFKPDVVYIHDLAVFNEADLKEMKKIAKLVVGQIACPLPLNQKPLYSYDLIVSSFHHYVEMFRKWGISSEYLRWCFEPTIIDNVGSKKRKYDVAFVGGFSPHHSQGNKVFENLAKVVKVDFWGYGANTLPPTSPIKKTYHGQAFGLVMYDIFASAKIVVNRHINVAGNTANNMRMFEATGMGALLITDEKPNMSEFFEAGKEVITYTSARDLTQKVKYYLKHPKEAAKIALAGQKRTLKDHSYSVRMTELSKILNKYIDEK